MDVLILGLNDNPIGVYSDEETALREKVAHQILMSRQLRLCGRDPVVVLHYWIRRFTIDAGAAL